MQLGVVVWGSPTRSSTEVRARRGVLVLGSQGTGTTTLAPTRHGCTRGGFCHLRVPVGCERSRCFTWIGLWGSHGTPNHP